MSRMPAEVRKNVCGTVRFYSEKKPSDLVTPVICISAVPEYKRKAKALLESLRKHHNSIPKIIAGSAEIKEITSQIASTGSRINRDMKELAEEFLRKEC